MSDTPTPPIDTPDAEEPIVELEVVVGRPWVTMVFIGVCVTVYLAVQFNDQLGLWEVLNFVYPTPRAIWEGAYWGPFTSCFMHLEIWHIALNVYWLWMLGGHMERVVGWRWFLAFCVTSGHVSSGFQLAVSDSTGIGLSGVVYAIFGFMWLTRERYPSFRACLSPGLAQLFVFWLGFCIALDLVGIMSIGNTAHCTGLLFGALVAWTLVFPHKRQSMIATLVAFAGLSFVPLSWCPWSVLWLQLQAQAAYEAEQFEESLEWCNRAIEKDPEAAWTYQARGYVHSQLGNTEAAQEDTQKARELDPSLFEDDEE